MKRKEGVRNIYIYIKKEQVTTLSRLGRGPELGRKAPSTPTLEAEPGIYYHEWVYGYTAYIAKLRFSDTIPLMNLSKLTLSYHPSALPALIRRFPVNTWPALLPYLLEMRLR